jgi:hypothetical protein
LNTLSPDQFPNSNVLDEDFDTLVTEVLPAMGIDGVKDLEDVYDCSHIQQGMLLAQLKNPNHYKVVMYFKILRSPESREGSVQIGRLEQAWQRVVERHSIMRTVFANTVSRDNIFQQVVLRHTTPRIFKLSEVNDLESGLRLLKGYPSLDDESQPHHQLVHCELQNRGIICKLEISHLLIDATSNPILFRDLCLAYDHPLPEEEVPYAKYLSYVRDHAHHHSLLYWKNYLKDLQPCLLPEFVDTIEPEISFGSVDISFSESGDLYSFCSKYDRTPSSVYQAVWSMVLRIYTGRDSICFGFLSSGRDLPIDGIENALGPYISMLVCRTEMNAIETVNDLLDDCQTNAFNSLSNQICPLSQIQHVLGLGESRLFDTILSVQREGTVSTISGSSIVIETLEMDDPTEVIQRNILELSRIC